MAAVPDTEATPTADVASNILDASTRRRGRQACPQCGAPKRAKRPKTETSDEKFFAGLLGLANAYPRRIESSGLVALADAVAIRDTLDRVIDAGIEIVRSERWSASWAEVAAATGISKQRAQQKWGSLGGARRPGGQPAGLR